MPIDVTPPDDAEESYKEGSRNAGARYERAVKRSDWLTPAASNEAQNLYNTKMQDPKVRARRQKMIKKRSNEFWQGQSVDNGAPIIGSRMEASSGRWKERTTPYLEAIANTKLPPKVADPMQNVTNRVGAVVKSVVDKKKQLLQE